MAHHNKKMLQDVQREQDISSCEQWFDIKNDGDYLHPKKKKPGLFMTPTGCCIYNYLYVAAEVPLAEISFCICAAPIIRGAIAMLTLIALLQYPILKSFLAAINFQ